MDVPITEADASLVGRLSEDDGDVAMYTPGDVNGYGIAEALFGGETVLVPGRSAGWGDVMDDGAIASSKRITEENDNQPGLPDRGQHGVLDGDGLDEVVLGASRYDHEGMEHAGQVRVLRGRTEWPMVLDQHEADSSVSPSATERGVQAQA